MTSRSSSAQQKAIGRRRVVASVPVNKVTTSAQTETAAQRAARLAAVAEAAAKEAAAAQEAAEAEAARQKAAQDPGEPAPWARIRSLSEKRNAPTLAHYDELRAILPKYPTGLVSEDLVRELGWSKGTANNVMQMAAVDGIVVIGKERYSATGQLRHVIAEDYFQLEMRRRRRGGVPSDPASA